MKASKQQESGLSRRAFLGALGVGIGVSSLSAAAAAVAPLEAAAATSSGTSIKPGRVGILYDAAKCVGCHYCEGGCKKANNLTGEVTFNINALPESVLPRLMIPVEMKKELDAIFPIVEDDHDAQRWLRVTQKTIESNNGETRDIYTRHSCTHCGLCAQVCPSKALVQREDGIVTMDTSRCIGCFYCYQACPFDIPRYRVEGEDRAMQKCTMCFGRVDLGKEPICVRECPTGALSFGPLEDMALAGQTEAAGLVAAGYQDASLYGEQELGGIGVLSVLVAAPGDYGLPKLPTT
jgi:formate dehydrogenase iron-sulfur subunit